ncbi:serine/threonine protein kinase, partial [Leucobacter sp. M11]|nr:serine/threonine protein kinase [Leucobacter sp. M11]
TSATIQAGTYKGMNKDEAFAMLTDLGFVDVQLVPGSPVPDSEVDRVTQIGPTGNVPFTQTIQLTYGVKASDAEAPGAAPTPSKPQMEQNSQQTVSWPNGSGLCPSNTAVLNYEVQASGGGASVVNQPGTGLTATVQAGTTDFSVSYRVVCGGQGIENRVSAWSPGATITVTAPTPPAADGSSDAGDSDSNSNNN